MYGMCIYIYIKCILNEWNKLYFYKIYCSLERIGFKPCLAAFAHYESHKVRNPLITLPGIYEGFPLYEIDVIIIIACTLACIPTIPIR